MKVQKRKKRQVGILTASNDSIRKICGVYGICARLTMILCVLFKDNIPLAELVLRIITDKPDLKVTRCETQKDMKRLAGARSNALRRTAGIRMVTSGVSVSTVAQILGHTDVESSKRYISLDTESLRGCCLNLGTMHTRKEGLS